MHKHWIARLFLLLAALMTIGCSVDTPMAVAMVDGVISLEVKPCSGDAKVGLVRLFRLDDNKVVGDEGDELIWSASFARGRGAQSFPLRSSIDGYRVDELNNASLREGVNYGFSAKTVDDVNLGAIDFDISGLRNAAAFWIDGGKKHYEPIDRWRSLDPGEIEGAC